MKLNYKKVGTGKPIIVLHGLFGSADNWFSVARELDQEYTLYLVDQRNHGDSPHDETWNYQTMAEDLKELLDDLGLDRAYLMGHSMGGKTVMNFALMYPKRVEKLIVVDIAPRYYPMHHQAILKGLNSIDLHAIRSRSEADEQLARYVSELGIRQFLLKSLTRSDRGFAWKVNLPVITREIDNIGQALPERGQYDGPVLFLAGSNSDYIQSKDFPDLQAHFPAYTLEFVRNAGHWIHAEQPHAVVREVRKFLG